MPPGTPPAGPPRSTWESALGSEAQETLRRFVEDAPVAMAMLDADLRYLSASRRWLDGYGMDPATYRGRRHYDLFPEIPEHWKAMHRRCLSGGLEECEGEPFVRADGSRQWVRWAVRPWHTASGTVGGLLMFTEETTARMNAEESLRETAEAMRLLQTASRGIVYVDAEGTIQAVNDATTSLFGWTAGELVGRSVETLLPSAFRHAHVHHRATYFTAPRPRPMGIGLDLVGQRKDGSTFPTEVSLNHVMTPAGVRAVAFVTDISARKEAERALRDSHAALEADSRELERRASRLAELTSELTLAEQHAREQLSKSLHDGLQQLLFSSRLKLDRLAARLAGGTDGTDLVASLRMEIDEAIAQARSLAVELFPATLHADGLSAGLRWLARWAKQKYDLTVDLTADAAADPVRRDVRTLVFESVRELLFNVVKHARTSRVALDLARTEDGMVRITIADRGVGFDPAAEVERQPGLGLLAIRERLAFLGGQLDVRSAPGHGATFTILAPCAASPARRNPAHAPAGDAATSPVPSAYDGREARPLRVLIADDHALVRSGLRELFADRPELEVVGEAADGCQAIEQARALKPDVIIMDVSMPNLDGVEATRRVLAELPFVQVFGLSTEEKPEGLHAIEAAGAAGYFTKNDDAHRLVARLLAVHATSAREEDAPASSSAGPAT